MQKGALKSFDPLKEGPWKTFTTNSPMKIEFIWFSIIFMTKRRPQIFWRSKGAPKNPFFFFFFCIRLPYKCLWMVHKCPSSYWNICLKLLILWLTQKEICNWGSCLWNSCLQSTKFCKIPINAKSIQIYWSPNCTQINLPWNSQNATILLLGSTQNMSILNVRIIPFYTCLWLKLEEILNLQIFSFFFFRFNNGNWIC